MSPILLVLLFQQLLSSLVAVQSVTFPSDFAALQAFKASIRSTSVPSYSCLGSWNFTSDPCSVPHIIHFTCGVSCSASRVTHLTLDPAGYTGTLSPLISKLTQLTILDLSDNNFYGPIPSTLFSLPNLQALILQFNSFSGSIPPSITTLKSLQSLDISHNSLVGPLPKSMNSLNNLRRLDLSFNKLSGSLPKLPPNLIELSIKANSLSGSLYKPSFDGLTLLKVVELGENSFNGSIPAWFFLISSLQQVDLTNNSFTGVEIWKPSNLGSDLVAVDLSFNRIQGNLPVNLFSYPMLSSLSFRYNRLSGPIPSEFSKKESLKRLFLDGNYLNGRPPAGFFSGQGSIIGSFGDNCLESCPASSQLCLKSQKPTSVCRQASGGKHRS